jgi:drug/metabolite transporter (DMT)-like permease
MILLQSDSLVKYRQITKRQIMLGFANFSASNKQASFNYALIALGIALFAIALSPILVRFSEVEISPYATAFDRFWMTAVALGLWQGLRGEAKDSATLSIWRPNDLQGWLVGVWRDWLHWEWFALGACLAGDLTLWAWALTQTSVANSTLLANLTPLFTTLCAWLFLGKCFDRRFLIGLSVTVLGSIALGIGDLTLGSSQLIGDLAALMAAVAFGGYLMVAERLQSRFNSTDLLFRASIVASILMLPLTILMGENPLPHSWSGWLAVLGLTIICQMMGQGFLVHSLNHLSASFVAIFLLLDPVLAAGGSALVFSEYLSFGNILACGIVLIGIYITLSSSTSGVSEGSA